MPSYSVGETRPSRGPGRREIGHGALAERALEPVIPSVEEFPYTLRLVSEVLSSNGSTSQGSICGSTLALMDAGVPIKAPVAGISCGLITEGDRWMTMVDIQGVEDFFGDMDFKVGGTKKGITAIQMDLKIDGLTPEIIKEAFAKTHKARNYILDEVMLKAIPAPRPELSKYAPKMLSMTIDPVSYTHLYGDRQDDDRQQRKFHWGRGEDLLEGGFTQLKAHQQDDHRNGQPGEVLYPTVAEGVMPIGFLPSQPETDERDHRGAGIG